VAWRNTWRYTSSISSDADTVEWEPDTGEGRVRAASYLTILNTELAPEELGHLVGLEPDESWRKGEPKRFVDGTPRLRSSGPQPYNGVHYESNLDEARTPSDHFKALIERLRPNAERIARVADLPTSQTTRIWIVEHTERDMIDAFLDPDDVAIAAAMHAQLIFSSYFYDESREDQASS
jgi:hypothetical protein